MDLKKFLEAIDYRITEGSEFCWTCFGDNAYSLSTWNGDHDGYSMNVTFDLKDQTVYSVEACDYKRKRAYRYLNPDHREAYLTYGKTKHAQYYNQSWDNVDYTDLEVEEDWIEKARCIVADKDYDTKVTIQVELSDNEIFTLMKMAHDRDITLNKLVEEILWMAIKDAEKTVADSVEGSTSDTTR